MAAATHGLGHQADVDNLSTETQGTDPHGIKLTDITADMLSHVKNASLLLFVKTAFPFCTIGNVYFSELNLRLGKGWLL